MENEPNRLRPLGNVGIGEHRTNLRSIALSDEPTEIVHASVGLEQVMHAGDTLCHIDLAPASPESALDRDGMHRNITQLGMRRLGQILHSLILPSWLIAESGDSSARGFSS